MNKVPEEADPALISDGKDIFRFDTFGDEDFWSGLLHIDKAIATGKYRTASLGGLFARAKGGFYHDGRFATLPDVIDHYNNYLQLNLSVNEKQELAEYLKSL